MAEVSGRKHLLEGLSFGVELPAVHLFNCRAFEDVGVQFGGEDEVHEVGLHIQRARLVQLVHDGGLPVGRRKIVEDGKRVDLHGVGLDVLIFRKPFADRLVILVRFAVTIETCDRIPEFAIECRSKFGALLKVAGLPS